VIRALALLAPALAGFGQAASGTVGGTVVDPSGLAISGASVEIRNPVSHYDRTLKTDPQSKFQFENVPYNNYHTTVTASGSTTMRTSTKPRTYSISL